MDSDIVMDDELLGEFINESREHLTTIEADYWPLKKLGPTSIWNL